MSSDPAPNGDAAAIEIIAHRGFSAAAPENTLAAIRAAIDAGADAVEWDLQTASCGTPVLLHDPHLGRTTNGFGPVRRRSMGQLGALDAGSWFSEEFAGEPIPTLAEALELVRPTDLRIYSEVKGYRELEDLDRMVAIVEAAHMVDRVRFISLDFGIVDRIAGQNAEIAVGHVVDEPSEVEAALASAGALGDRGMLDFDRRMILDDPDLVGRARSVGAEVAVWTVDDPEEADRLLGTGVRRFTTNEVTVLMNWRSMRPGA
ncbi:MAG TPA: glycerophosphodiester phosphodiesterase family protein [Longimicrobiales bacterium]|nr:glycerophosphodiester phosphodiesterase family protein [Longimicrobiales bacterium]